MPAAVSGAADKFLPAGPGTRSVRPCEPPGTSYVPVMTRQFENEEVSPFALLVVTVAVRARPASEPQKLVENVAFPEGSVVTFREVSYRSPWGLAPKCGGPWDWRSSAGCSE